MHSHPHTPFRALRGLSTVAVLAAAQSALALSAPPDALLPRPAQQVSAGDAGSRHAEHATPAKRRVQSAQPGTLGPDARQLVAWVRQTGDNHGVPFAVIDKRRARVFVFTPQGKLRGSAPVLLGLARGDDTVPGIGDKPLSQVKPEERTTPAGRFVAEHGTNMRGEHVIWVDYDAAVSMHPVLTTNPKERRLHRLATPSVADNRISYGCVNVPKAFFSSVVLKTLDAPRPIVYVLPETRSLGATFAGFDSGHTTAAHVAGVQSARR